MYRYLIVGSYERIDLSAKSMLCFLYAHIYMKPPNSYVIHSAIHVKNNFTTPPWRCLLSASGHPLHYLISILNIFYFAHHWILFWNLAYIFFFVNKCFAWYFDLTAKIPEPINRTDQIFTPRKKNLFNYSIG